MAWKRFWLQLTIMLVTFGGAAAVGNYLSPCRAQKQFQQSGVVRPLGEVKLKVITKEELCRDDPTHRLCWPE